MRYCPGSTRISKDSSIYCLRQIAGACWLPHLASLIGGTDPSTKKLLVSLYNYQLYNAY